MTASRKAAALVLWAVSRGRRLDRAFGEVAPDLPSRDRRWVQEASYGAVRFRGRLDYLLDLHLSKGLASLPPRVLDLLRLGAYQLLFMDAVPAYAAISQTVELVRGEMGPGGGRLANGVLRSLDREGGEEGRFPHPETHPLEYFSTWGSHPSWMVSRWLERWGVEETGALVLANNAPPPLYLRPFSQDLPAVIAELEGRGWSARSLGDGIPCLLLEGGTNPALLLEDFPGIVQDPGAAMVTVYADPPSEGWVLDLCSAPGGKALALAGEGHRIVAGDRSLARMKMIREARDRVGGKMEMFVADARHPPLASAPFVLLDVPCTGTGTLRRHPDARWRLTEEMLKTLVQLQADILDGATALVPVGGHMVYSTCTLEEEENEEQMVRFLKRNPHFRLAPTGAVPSGFLTDGGFLRLLPQDWGFDGAFSARMLRVG